ncbi:MAG: hypothetical protein ED859_00830 [Desulfuromonadales bacterium]|nr:MAG: hypothetical protein ED859_00830 [Desulfuromonadales bacterium]
MTPYNPLNQLPGAAGYTGNDVFVLFGELFGRGYANGIVDEARKAGMTIIGATVGRRDNNGPLRPLTAEELAEAETNLGGKIINIPLEAGFDLEPAADGLTPADRLKGVKPDTVAETKLDMAAIEESRQKGLARFRENLAAFVRELEKLVPTGRNLLVAHTMAGGIPRARTLMPLLNRVFKGQGDRYLSSELFWNSDTGRLCSLSFDEVTADTFGALIAATAPLRDRLEGEGARVSYSAYGYHGCGVLIGGEYRWQSYTPYLQGWAKIRLEDVAAKAWQEGVKATVYNCPEIQTNSSALFLGVELSLFPFLSALEREGDGPVAQEIRKACQALLKEGETLDGLLAKTEAYLASPILKPFDRYEEWPHHNTPEQADFMLATSDEMMAMNADPKNIVCAELSRAVFHGVGRLMFDHSWAPGAPVVWLNHDVIARRLVA